VSATSVGASHVGAAELLGIEHGADHRSTLVLGDLGKRNALSTELAEALKDAIDHLPAETKVVALRSSGPVFCSGADLKGGSGGVAVAIRAIVECPVPVVAEVSGPALGAGVSLIAFATYALMAEEAWCSLPEVEKLGRFPTGVAAELSPLSGMRLLSDVAVTGRRLPGREVVAAGWATAAHPRGELPAAVDALTAGLAAHPRDVLVQLQESWRRWLRSVGATAALLEAR